MKKSMNHCIWAAFGPGRPLAFRFGAEELSSSLINSLALKAQLGWWMQPNLHHGYQMIFQSTHQNFWWNYTCDIIWLYYLDQYASFMVPLNYKLHVNNRCWICWISSLIIIKYMEQKKQERVCKKHSILSPQPSPAAWPKARGAPPSPPWPSAPPPWAAPPAPDCAARPWRRRPSKRRRSAAPGPGWRISKGWGKNHDFLKHVFFGCGGEKLIFHDISWYFPGIYKII